MRMKSRWFIVWGLRFVQMPHATKSGGKLAATTNVTSHDVECPTHGSKPFASSIQLTNGARVRFPATLMAGPFTGKAVFVLWFEHDQSLFQLLSGFTLWLHCEVHVLWLAMSQGMASCGLVALQRAWRLRRAIVVRVPI